MTHTRQPTRLPHPWDSPGKNTGVGCHCLLQRMKVKSESEVTQSCLTPSDPADCSLPGSSVPGICQARVLEWVAIAFSGKPTITETKTSLNSIKVSFQYIDSRNKTQHSLKENTNKMLYKDSFTMSGYNCKLLDIWGRRKN